MNYYTPIFGQECARCDHDVCVGINGDEGVQSTGLCGVHFFADRTMVDWEEWNEGRESTE